MAYAIGDRSHSAGYPATGRDAGSTDQYWCPTCGHPEYQCTCACECDCTCTLQLQCECTCQSTHRRACKRATGRKCQCLIACTCKHRCARTNKHMMDREATKPVMVWDHATAQQRPAIIDGTTVVQTHGYSPMRSRKFGLAKGNATRWHRPTENAAIGTPHPADWDGDEYVTLTMDTAQLAAFTVAHQFVKTQVPGYRDKGRQGILDGMLTKSRRGETHSVRMFTASDLRKLTKRLPKRLLRGELKPILGNYAK